MMRKYLIILALCIFIGFGVCDGTEDTNDEEFIVHLGEYPYFALIYFMDDSVKSLGYHFLRAGVLIRMDMIISASIAKGGDDDLGFPRKTLLARLGRVSTEFWGRVNKGIGEQEREIIKIFRPATYTQIDWWMSDISLMQTVTAFDINKHVSVAPWPLTDQIISPDSDCTVVVFQDKRPNVVLRKVEVKMMNDKESCGKHYLPKQMLCSTGFDLLTGAGELDGYCLANSGGPLICNNTVIATQTYRHPACKPPHLYQRLDYWSDLIECALKNDCQSKQCEVVCSVSDKDSDEESGSEENIEPVAEEATEAKPKRSPARNKTFTASLAPCPTVSYVSALLSMFFFVILT